MLAAQDRPEVFWAVGADCLVQSKRQVDVVAAGTQNAGSNRQQGAEGPLQVASAESKVQLDEELHLVVLTGGFHHGSLSVRSGVDEGRRGPGSQLRPAGSFAYT